MDDLKGLIVLLLIALVTIAVIGGVGLAADRAFCMGKTQGMGMASRWSPLGGCQVEVQEGRWIPLDSYYWKEE